MSKQPNRPRLGRGLNALLSLSEDISASSESTASTLTEASTHSQEPMSPTPWRMIDLNQIQPNPHQPRRTMNQESLTELANSLKANGLLQPVLVRPIENGYQLIAGERRFRAAQQAGFTQIPALVRDTDPYTQAQLALIENIHREDLNPIERALGYQDLMTKLGLTQVELAMRLNEQRSTIANHLRLLELAEPVRHWIRDGLLTVGHAKVLASITDPDDQIRLAKLCVDQGLSVRNLERVIANRSTKPETTSTPVSAHIRDLETTLSRELGLRVQVRGATKKGRVIIHYSNLDQFDELMKRLNVQLESL
jgi:ParB family chromosome partitioning protein